jgi:hypothetical protein
MIMRDVKYLRLREEIKPYLKMLREASRTIRDQDVSNYPIFVFHQQIIELGVSLVDRDETSGNWSVNASTLEEFVARQLIDQEAIPGFKKHYHDPDTHHCLFVLSELGAEFVFLPQELAGDN